MWNIFRYRVPSLNHFNIVNVLTARKGRKMEGFHGEEKRCTLRSDDKDTRIPLFRVDRAALRFDGPVLRTYMCKQGDNVFKVRPVGDGGGETGRPARYTYCNRC